MPDSWNRRGAGSLPGQLGMVVTHTAPGEMRTQLPVAEHLMAPDGFLHAASLVILAETCCGYGCVTSLPEGAKGFTTVELKSNFLGTAVDGHVECVARAEHLSTSTQVWDATVTHVESGRVLALFRCTQMVLYPKAGGQ